MATSKGPIVEPLIFETYLAVIKNSVGARTWQTILAEVNGERKDILRQGELSCAFFVSSILYLFNLIGEVHATVNGILEDMKKSGWQEIANPKVGAVLIYDSIRYEDGEEHNHIGFFIGKGKAISNRYREGVPAEHEANFDEQKRGVVSKWWHPKLSKKVWEMGSKPKD